MDGHGHVAGSAGDRALLIDFAQSVVSDVAPAELPLFEALARESADDELRVTRRGDGQVGFGADLVTISVVVLPVMNFVSTLLGDLLLDVVKDETKDGIRSIIRRLLRREPRASDALNPETLDRVRIAAFEQASSLGLSTEKATLLADAIAGRLSSSTAVPWPPPTAPTDP